MLSNNLIDIDKVQKMVAKTLKLIENLIINCCQFGFSHSKHFISKNFCYMQNILLQMNFIEIMVRFITTTRN